MDESKLFKESKYTLEEAKKKFPKWYERVILNKNTEDVDASKRRKWRIEEKVHGENPHALYDWWLNKIKSGATYGHRYFCIMMLPIYAVKCNVSKERLEQDAYALIPKLDALHSDDKFTESDVKSALECFDDRYATFPIRDIEKLSAIPIELNKRNGKSQGEHLEEARAIRDVRQKRNGTVWYHTEGRPSAKRQILEWQKKFPKGTQKECERETGLSHGTVSKYWDRYFAFHQIKNWREENPEGKKSLCYQETGLSYPTIRKWWDCNIPSNEHPEIAIENFIKQNQNASAEEVAETLHCPQNIVTLIFNRMNSNAKSSSATKKSEKHIQYEDFYQFIHTLQVMKEISYEEAIDTACELLNLSKADLEIINASKKET